MPIDNAPIEMTWADTTTTWATTNTGTADTVVYVRHEPALWEPTEVLDEFPREAPTRTREVPLNRLKARSRGLPR